MKVSITVWLLTWLTVSLAAGKSLTQNFDKAAYFHAMASDHIEEVDRVLSVLQAETGIEKEAYEGALLMKKAGLSGNPKDKLHFFKKGRIELETVLKVDSTNAEYRFLRLIIEEHAPKIVGYKANMKADAQFVTKGYKSFSPAVQHAVADYSKTSKVLNPQDF